MDSWVVRAEDLVGEQRTDPSLAWLVPQQAFWSDEEVKISFSSKFSTGLLLVPFQLTINRNVPSSLIDITSFKKLHIDGADFYANCKM